MSDVNWDLAPEGATALKLDMHNNIYWVDDKNMPWVGTGWDNSSHHSSWKTIATRPQERKTIQDVLDAYPEWPEKYEGDEWIGIGVTSHGTITPYQKGSDVDRNKKGCYPICTREEFEAYVREQKQERKTIQDVLEAYPNGWPENYKDGYDAMAYNKGSDAFFCYKSYHTLADGWELICTREEYEKARGEEVRQKSTSEYPPLTQSLIDEADQDKEWTHTYDGIKCRVIINEPDREGYIVVVNELREYYIADDEDLKPIKPQISKANAWDMFMSGYAAERIKETYDVVDESSEVES